MKAKISLLLAAVLFGANVTIAASNFTYTEQTPTLHINSSNTIRHLNSVHSQTIFKDKIIITIK